MTVNALWILAFCLVTAAAAGALKWARASPKSFRPVGLAVLYVSSLAFFGIWCVNFGSGRVASALSSFIPPSAIPAATKALANNQVPRTLYFFFMYVAVLVCFWFSRCETVTDRKSLDGHTGHRGCLRAGVRTAPILPAVCRA